MSTFLSLSHMPAYTARPHIHGVPVYVPAFSDTHCARPQMDGQAELTWGWGELAIYENGLPACTQVLSQPGCGPQLWLTPTLNNTTLMQNAHVALGLWGLSRHNVMLLSLHFGHYIAGLSCVCVCIAHNVNFRKPANWTLQITAQLTHAST